MAMFAVICAQILFAQYVFSQVITAPNSMAGGIPNQVLPVSMMPGTPYGPIGPQFGQMNGYTPLYGGNGNGDVAVVGELPVTGTTAVTGHVPLTGKVQFTGSIPAGGIVTISGQCGCGCNGQTSTYGSKPYNNYLY